MAEQYIFKVNYISDEEVYEIFCESVSASDMYGFICLEDFIFGEASHLVIDPSEERIKNEFKDVKAVYIPANLILSIYEIKRKDITPKIKNLSETDKKVSQFPSRVYHPTRDH